MPSALPSEILNRRPRVGAEVKRTGPWQLSAARSLTIRGRNAFVNAIRVRPASET